LGFGVWGLQGYLAHDSNSKPQFQTVTRLFSECSLIMTKKRNRISLANLSLLTFLNRSWHVAIEWQQAQMRDTV
jgi:hypothetical protein